MYPVYYITSCVTRFAKLQYRCTCTWYHSYSHSVQRQLLNAVLQWPFLSIACAAFLHGCLRVSFSKLSFECELLLSSYYSITKPYNMSYLARCTCRENGKVFKFSNFTLNCVFVQFERNTFMINPTQILKLSMLILGIDRWIN